MRRKLIAGNWKMNLGIKESEKLASEIVKKTGSNILKKTDVLICPPFISIPAVSKILKNTGILLGAQNLSSENDGAYTGEISASMLHSAGCGYVIVGHSERRKYFHETNPVVNAKAVQSLKHGLKTIICVGETFQEREDEIFESIIIEQVRTALNDIPAGKMKDVIIAYEPVWAIGTGLNATPEQASAIHLLINNTAEEIFGKEISGELLIIYGGSVNAGNAYDILSAERIDGALIGGASLKADDFVFISDTASKLK
ncbi:MAG: triose-phosphate isomerase [Bacteroidetes bacterium]|nr:triose-phosphate isomerase [Bacteroidota bacterium]